MGLSWTKSWNSGDDGSALGGADIQNIQSNIDSQCLLLAGAQTITGNKTISVSTGTGLYIADAGTSHGLHILCSGTLSGSTTGHGIYLVSSVAQTAGALLKIHSDHASSTADIMQATNDGTGHIIYSDQVGVLASGKYALQIYSNVAQVTSGLVKFDMNHASSDKIVVTVQNAGTGNALFIDSDDGASLIIDSEEANDGIIVGITPAGTSPSTFEIIRNDDVTGNIVMKLGSGYIWVDTTGDLRVHSSAPTSDTGGTVVGAQTA